MGKLKNIEIYFDNNKNVYYPGDILSGNIMIETRGELRINALKVFIRGIGKVHWTETKTAGYRLGNYTEHYRSEIEYILLKQTLVGGKDNHNMTNTNNNRGGTKEFICEGFHIFPFSFVLPRSGMVTSFEGKHGSIRYYLKAELDKPWAFNHKLKKLFTVINPIDINEREYLVPICNECSKTLCCWFCTSGPISINVKTDRRGYCPGESVLLNAVFENHGNRNVVPAATLYQIQTYNASGKHFITTNKLNSITGPSITARSEIEWAGKLLKIPPVSPSIVSNLIRVEYFVKMCLLIPGSYSLSCVLPIIVGTVPYRRNQATTAIYQLMPSGLNYNQNGQRHDAPPAYADVARLEIGDDDDEEGSSPRGGRNGQRRGRSGAAQDDDQDDRIASNYTPLYTYVSDYIPPPPYSSISN